MTASSACVEFIKEVEGFSAKPYYDYQQHTVGYGTKCPTDKYFDYMNNGISKSEAEILLQEAITEICNTINEKLIGHYNLRFQQHQFDALVSFSFNLGTSWMTYDSTLRNALLNHADMDTIIYAFSLYSTAGGNYSTGLIKRRLCEANMFLNNIYSKNITDAYGYVFYEPNGGSLTYRVQGFLCKNNASPAEDALRNGDVFLGWYTDLTGGSRVITLTKDLSGKTLFARWQSSENAEEQSSGSTVVRVTGDVVNIRKGPGTNYGIATQVYQNDVLLVSSITNHTGMKWGKVRDGWICLDYTDYGKVLNNNKSSNSGQDSSGNNQNRIWGVVHSADGLRIRSGPGTTHSTVGFLSNQQKIEILEQITVGATHWGRIKTGWICMDYIKTEAPRPDGSGTEPEPKPNPGQAENTELRGKVTADALRIRSGAGTDNAIVGFYYQDDIITIYQTVLIDNVYWGKTDLGWINMEHILTNAPVNTPSASPGTGTKTVIADCLRVRKAIGTDQKIAELLYYGDKVTVLETTIVDNTVWGRVANGWICMDYVQ